MTPLIDDWFLYWFPLRAIQKVCHSPRGKGVDKKWQSVTDIGEEREVKCDIIPFAKLNHQIYIDLNVFFAIF